MTRQTATKKVSRPGGRTEQNRRAVAAAVLKLIGDGRFDFEIQEVAALAGVHRTTLFRRWPDKASLLAEALAEHVARIRMEFSGDWKADLHKAGLVLRDFLSDPVELAMNRILATTNNTDLRKQMSLHWAPILETLHQPIKEAQAGGDLPAEVDGEAVILLLISTLLTETVFTETIPDDARVKRIVAQIIRGCI